MFSLQSSSPGPSPSDGALTSLSAGRNAEIGMSSRDRLDAFRTALTPAWEIKPADAASFDMSDQICLMGDAVFFSSHYAQMTMDRAAHNVRKSEVDYYALQIKQRGEIRLDADGKRVRAMPGQILLSDFSRPSVAELDGGDVVMLLLPRGEFDRALGRQLDLHGINLHQAAGGGVAALLASHLTALQALLFRMSAAEAAGAVQATMHLLAAALAPSVDSLGLARPAIDRSLTRQARELVEHELKSPDLGPDMLCRRLGVSRSRLYRLFEPFGGVAAYVKERRLARIHSELSSRTSSSGHRYLGQLADDYGFLNQSTFSRAFRQQYGYTPRDAREMNGLPSLDSTGHRIVHDGGIANGGVRLWPLSAFDV